MRRSVVLAIVLGSLVTAAPVHAQFPEATQGSESKLNPLVSRDAFDPVQSVTFDFEIFPSGTPMAEALSAWGIRMPDSPEASVTLAARSGILGLNFDTFVVLSPRQEGAAPNFPLTIDFEFPLHRVGFEVLVFGGSQATLTAFDPRGKLLGTVISTGLFLGAETNDPAGIGKIVIEYEGTTFQEIDDLTIEYLLPREFQTCLAQIGNGITPDFALRTVVAAVNPWNFPVQARLLLRDDDGNPLSMRLGDRTGSEFSLDLPDRGALFLSSSGDEFAVGSACLSAPAPLTGTATFQVFGLDGRLLAEAGVDADTGGHTLVAAMQRSTVLGLDSGVALVNLSDEPISIWLFLDTRPSLTPGVVIDLAPHGHVARFVTELFGEILDPEYEGSFLMFSRHRFSAAVLRTSSGRVLSSQPVARTER